MSNVPAVSQTTALSQVATHPIAIQALPIAVPDSSEKELALKDILAILARRKWVILFTTMITVLFALIFTFGTRPTYVAHATLQIEREAPQVVSFDPQSSGGAVVSDPKDPFFRTRYEMLKSRALAEIVVTQEKLEESLRTMKNPPESMAWFFETFSLPDFGKLLPKPSSGGAGGEAEEEPLEDITTLFGKQLQVLPIDGTHLVDVIYEGASRKEAKRTVDSIVNNFIQMQIDTRSETGEYAKQFLTRELERAREALLEAEKKLVAYSNRNGILSIDNNQSRYVSKLNSLSAALVQAEIRRTAAESQFREMQDTGTVTAITTNPVITNLKAQLVELESQYQEKLKLFKPGYPDMQRLQQQINTIRAKLRTEESTIKGSLESEFESARRQENQLRAELERFNKTLYSQQGNSVDYNTLKREVDASGKLYNGLLERLEETSVTSNADANTSSITIVDPARLPVRKYRPNPKLNVIVGTLAGLLLGLGFAFLRDSLDQSIRTPDDLQKHTGVGVLGAIPRPNRAARKNLALACKTAPRSAFAEAYRVFAANMRFQNNGEEEHILLVTSVSENQGKSTTACNLACAYAQMGLRVLLIDADLRRPSLHKKFQLQNGQGLADYLDNECDLIGITQAIKPIPNLYAIPAGNTSNDPMRLLSNEKMAFLIAQASQRFDYVIIDSAPASGLAETLVLSSLATQTLIVTNEDNLKHETSRIKRTVDQLERIKKNVAGFLLVNAKSISKEDRKKYQRVRNAGKSALASI